MFKSPAAYSDVKNTIYVVFLESATKPTNAWRVRIEITFETRKYYYGIK